MRRRSTVLFYCACMMIMLMNSARAQHFAFFEAESQQPFFIKYNGNVISSTPGGFLMISSIMESAIDVVVGFPGAGSVQTGYRIEGLNRDRGFYLRKAERGEWILMDRNDMTVIQGSLWEPAPSPKAAPSATPPSPKPTASVTPPSSKSSPSVPSSQSAKQTKPQPSASASPANPAPPTTSIRSLLPLISYLNIYEDETYLARIYFERPGKGKTDTIIVEIDKRVKYPIRNPANK